MGFQGSFNTKGMSLIKRVISVLLALVLVFSFSSTTFAIVTHNVSTESSKLSLQGAELNEEAEKVLDLINEIRLAEGVNQLVWENALVEPAKQRAAENVITLGHTRPNGSEWYTVSDYAFGENLTAGTYLITAEDAVARWMKSPAHKKLILSPKFSTMAVGTFVPYETCDTQGYAYYWALLFGIGESVEYMPVTGIDSTLPITIYTDPSIAKYANQSPVKATLSVISNVGTMSAKLQANSISANFNIIKKTLEQSFKN